MLTRRRAWGLFLGMTVAPMVAAMLLVPLLLGADTLGHPIRLPTGVLQSCTGGCAIGEDADGLGTGGRYSYVDMHGLASAIIDMRATNTPTIEIQVCALGSAALCDTNSAWRQVTGSSSVTNGKNLQVVVNSGLLRTKVTACASCTFETYADAGAIRTAP